MTIYHSADAVSQARVDQIAHQMAGMPYGETFALPADMTFSSEEAMHSFCERLCARVEEIEAKPT